MRRILTLKTFRNPTYTKLHKFILCFKDCDAFTANKTNNPIMLIAIRIIL